MAKKPSRKAVQHVKRKVVVATKSPIKKAVPPAKQPSAPTVTQQMAAIDEQIRALEAKKATFKEQAIRELKARIGEANKVVRELETVLADKIGRYKPRR